MSFIRVKTISGCRYAYEVENYWTDKGSRQRTKEYLGRIYKPVATRETLLYLPDDTELPDLITRLARHTLITHGFEQEGPHLVWKHVRADIERGTFTAHDKPAVIELNEGFLCEQTYRRLRAYHPTRERFEKELATLLLGAGMQIPSEEFVRIFLAAKKRFKTNNSEGNNT